MRYIFHMKSIFFTTDDDDDEREREKMHTGFCAFHSHFIY